MLSEWGQRIIEERAKLLDLLARQAQANAALKAEIEALALFVEQFTKDKS